jgi:hypothetical protein
MQVVPIALSTELMLNCKPFYKTYSNECEVSRHLELAASRQQLLAGVVRHMNATLRVVRSTYKERKTVACNIAVPIVYFTNKR